MSAAMQSVPTAGPTCIEIRARAREYASQHGVSMVDAFEQLGLVGQYAAAQLAAAGPGSLSTEQCVVLAHAHAQRHDVGLGESLQALGIRGEAAVAAAVRSALRTFSEATGTTLNTDVLERLRSGIAASTSAEAERRVERPVEPAGAPLPSLQQAAAAASAVALFNQANRGNHA